MAYKYRLRGPIRTTNSSGSAANTYGFGGTADASSNFIFYFAAWVRFNELGHVVVGTNSTNYGFTLELLSSGYLKMTTRFNGNSSVGYSYHKFTTGVMYNLRIRSATDADSSNTNKRLYYKFSTDGTNPGAPEAGSLGTAFRTAAGGSSAATFLNVSYEINQRTTIDPDAVCVFRGTVTLRTTDGAGTKRSASFAINSLGLGKSINQSLASKGAGGASTTVYFRSTKVTANDCMGRLIDSNGNIDYKCCYLIDSKGNVKELDWLVNKHSVISS